MSWSRARIFQGLLGNTEICGDNFLRLQMYVERNKMNKRFSLCAFKAVAKYFVEGIFDFRSYGMYSTAVKSWESLKIGSNLLSKSVPYSPAWNAYFFFINIYSGWLLKEL